MIAAEGSTQGSIQSDLEDGWLLQCSGVGYNNVLGEDCTGSSSHVTSLSGASFGLTFYGMRSKFGLPGIRAQADHIGSTIYVYGSTNSSYTVSMDGGTAAQVNPSGEVLFSQGGLEPHMHYLNLTVFSLPNSSQQLAFDSVVVTAQTDGGYACSNFQFISWLISIL